jgi:hypothetical protein
VIFSNAWPFGMALQLPGVTPDCVEAYKLYCCAPGTASQLTVTAGMPGCTLRLEGAVNGALTAKVAMLELMPFIEAVTVVLPCAKDKAMPLAFSVATAVLLDAQVTEPEMLPVLLSE